MPEVTYYVDVQSYKPKRFCVIKKAAYDSGHLAEHETVIKDLFTRAEAELEAEKLNEKET